MTTASYHVPPRREVLGDLFDRLTRIQAATATVRALVGADSTDTTLCDALQALEHDLLLAMRASETARGRLRP
jgi:hypothetical protein